MSEFLKLDMGPMSPIPVRGRGMGNLFLGNIPNALALSEAPQERFWAVLNCTDDPALDYMKKDAEFDVMRLNQWDGEPYPGMSIKMGIEYIDENLKAGSNVLVCCHAGASRSPGMVVAYLIYQWLEEIPREKLRLEDIKAAYEDANKVVVKSRYFIHIHPQIDLSIRQYFHLAPKSAEDLIA